jgi:putative oxidoreductase
MAPRVYVEDTVLPARPELAALSEERAVAITLPKGRVADRVFVAYRAAEVAVLGWLARHSVTALRVSLGAVLLGFGFLKYFPGMSPAQSLVLATMHRLTFGLVPTVVPNTAAMVLVATLECTIGLLLITGRWLRLTMGLLAVQLAGILSPTVLLPGRLFSGPHHMPTLEGQYVLKDVVLLTAAMVIATTIRVRSHEG